MNILEKQGAPLLNGTLTERLPSFRKYMTPVLLLLSISLSSPVSSQYQDAHLIRGGGEVPPNAQCFQRLPVQDLFYRCLPQVLLADGDKKKKKKNKKKSPPRRDKCGRYGQWCRFV